MGYAKFGTVGRRGKVVIPACLCERFGIKEGSYVFLEERDEGILIRPADAFPYERYTPERVAEFLLNCAVDAADYAEAVKEVRALGLDPAKIDHIKPPGV